MLLPELHHLTYNDGPRPLPIGATKVDPLELMLPVLIYIANSGNYPIQGSTHISLSAIAPKPHHNTAIVVINSYFYMSNNQI